MFANLRHNKRLDRFTLRGRTKVDGQWKLFCLVHNIEKLAHAGYAAQEAITEARVFARTSPQSRGPNTQRAHLGGDIDWNSPTPNANGLSYNLNVGVLQQRSHEIARAARIPQSAVCSNGSLDVMLVISPPKDLN